MAILALCEKPLLGQDDSIGQDRRDRLSRLVEATVVFFLAGNAKNKEKESIVCASLHIGVKRPPKLRP